MRFAGRHRAEGSLYGCLHGAFWARRVPGCGPGGVRAGGRAGALRVRGLRWRRGCCGSGPRDGGGAGVCGEDAGVRGRGLALAYLTSTHFNTHLPHNHASHSHKQHPHHAASPTVPTHATLTPQQHTTAYPNLGQTRQRRTPHADGARRRGLRRLRAGPPTPLRSNTTPTTRIPRRQPSGKRSFFHRTSPSTDASTSQHWRRRSARLPRPPRGNPPRRWRPGRQRKRLRRRLLVHVGTLRNHGPPTYRDLTVGAPTRRPR